MELWIRSQDRECLMKVYRLDYDWYKNEHKIVANGFKVTLATYDTQERALEVLDKLQEVLMMCIKANGTEYLEGTSCYVYEMPQE